MSSALRIAAGVLLVLVGLAQLTTHAVIALGLIGLGISIIRKSRTPAIIFGIIAIAGFFVPPAWNVYLLVILVAPFALLFFGYMSRSSGTMSSPAPARPIRVGGSPCPSCNGSFNYQNTTNCSRCGGSGYV